MFYEHDNAIYNLMTMKRARKRGKAKIQLVYHRDWFDLYFETVEDRDVAWETIKGRLSEFNANVHITGGLH